MSKKTLIILLAVLALLFGAVFAGVKFLYFVKSHLQVIFVFKWFYIKLDPILAESRVGYWADDGVIA